MIKIALLQALKGLLATALSEKFLVNLVVTLAEWLAKRTSNDLDDKLVKQVKDALDRHYNKPTNLYRELR